MKKIFLLLIPLFCVVMSYAQKDSVVFRNGNYMTGTIQSMNKGVLLMETAYSDADFKIDWEEIVFLHSDQNFHFVLIDGTRVLGRLDAEIANHELTVLTESGEVKIALKEITEIQTFDLKFFDRVNASIDLGYSYTKANNLSQFSLRSNLGYTSRKWRSFLTYNSVLSSQDDVASTKRTDGDVGGDYFLPKNWYLTTRYTYLQNDEQQLNLRSVFSGGIGKYIFRTNKMYCGVVGGLAYNIEDFVPVDQEDRYSTEGMFRAELNLFNVKDFSLLTTLTVYPSITEKDRIRTDFNIDLKYDLPLDFYIGVGYRINYDNQPIEDASDTDYVFQTSIGWSL